MKKRNRLSPAAQTAVIALVVAAIGVVIQIRSGAPYPQVPPVFFILLIPAALLFFGGWKWTPILVLLVGLFLTNGLFTSGASKRLFSFGNTGDTAGLWLQALAVAVATISALFASFRNFKRSSARA